MRNYAETFCVYKGYKIYPHVRITFLWRQLHVSIARKRGSPPLKFLDENECRLCHFHDGVKKIGG